MKEESEVKWNGVEWMEMDDWVEMECRRALSGFVGLVGPFSLLELDWTRLGKGKWPPSIYPRYSALLYFLLFTLQGGRREEGSGAPEPDQGKAGKKKKKKKTRWRRWEKDG